MTKSGCLNWCIGAINTDTRMEAPSKNYKKLRRVFVLSLIVSSYSPNASKDV